jgi:predicted ATPase
VDVRRGLFACYYSRGTHALAQQQGQEVKALAERLGDPGARMLAHWMLGCVAFWRGELVDADRELEDAIALYDPKQQQANTLALQIDPGANALCHRGWLQWTLGYPDRAVQTSEHAIKTARDLNQPFALSMALFFAIVTRTCRGDWETAARQLEELTSVTTEHALEYLRSVARVLKGQELIASDRVAAGVDETSIALSELEAQEAGLGRPWTLSILALGYTRLGKIAEGLDTLAKAFAVAERTGERHWEAELHRQRGDLLLLEASPDEAEAERCYRSALQVARLQHATSLALRAAMSLARLLEQQGKHRAAQQALAAAHARVSEGFDSADMRAANERLQSLGDYRRGEARSS